MKKVLSLFLGAVLVFSISCKKETATVLTSTEAKSALDESTSNITSDITGITNSEGYEALNNMQAMNTPFGNPVKTAVTYVKSRKLKSLRSAHGGNFDFEAAKGEYEYDYANDTVVKVANSTITDKLVLHYPSDSMVKTVNDAVLTIYDYTDQQVLTPDTLYPWGQQPIPTTDTSYMPTKISGDIVIKGVKTVEVSLTASYTVDGDPKSIDATVSLLPYSLRATYTEGGVTQSASLTLKNGTKTVAAVGGTLTYPSATDREMPDMIDGYVQLDNIKATGKVDIKAMDALTKDPTAADINKNIVISFYKANDGSKIGDLKVYDETDEYGEPTTNAYIYFSDGTKEPAKTYLDKVQTELDKIKF